MHSDRTASAIEAGAIRIYSLFRIAIHSFRGLAQISAVGPEIIPEFWERMNRIFGICSRYSNGKSLFQLS
jgi:hypothetical protein